MTDPEKNYTTEELASLYEKNSAEKIAEITGIKLYQVYLVLRDAGVEIRPRGHRPILENPGKEFLENIMHLENLSQQGLAERQGVSKRTIQRWLGK